MSGISSCKNFLRGLDIIELKSIRVEIVRPKIVGPAIVENIERNLGDPKTLVIHFKKKESFRGIFDREDIVVNQEIPGEGISRSRNDNRRSTSNENRKSSLITAVSSSGPKEVMAPFSSSVNSPLVVFEGEDKDSTCEPRAEKGRLRRSRSISGDRRDRSRSSSISKRRKSLHLDTIRPIPSKIEKKSRGLSPYSQPIGTPGLYIPPKSDYLKYENRDAQKIIRTKSPGPSCSGTYYKNKEYFRRLPSHSKALRGIFDREDIVVHQEIPGERNSRSRNGGDRRSTSNENRRGRDSASESRYDKGSSRRSRSISGDRYRSSPRYRRSRSRSSSVRKRSLSPHRDTTRRVPHVLERRSRSKSQPIRKPGLYIPPKSDYLRYEKRDTQKVIRSRSPGPSCSGTYNKDKEYSSRSPSRRNSPNKNKRSRTPHGDYRESSSKRRSESPRKFEKRRSRSLSPVKSRQRRERTSPSFERDDSRKPRLNSRSPKRFEGSRDSKCDSGYRDLVEANSRHLEKTRRRSRSPPKRSRTPPRRSRSPRYRRNRSRSRSRRNTDYRPRRSRSRDKATEDDIHYGSANMPPYILRDGEYWIPAPHAGFIPRGYLPPPVIYSRGFPPPIMMPRMPMSMMQPYRPRMYRPQVQDPSSNTTISSTTVTSKSQSAVDEQSEQKCGTGEIADVH